MTRRGRGQRSREAILRAALALLVERGYEGTSISRLCARSGLPPSSIYWHFGSKEGVLRAVLERETMRFLEGLPRPRPAGDPESRLRSLVEALGRAAIAHPAYARLLLGVGLQQSPSGPVAAAARRVREMAVAWLGEELRATFELGAGESARAEVLARHILAVLDGAVVAHALEGIDVCPLLDALPGSLAALAVPASAGEGRSRNRA